MSLSNAHWDKPLTIAPTLTPAALDSYFECVQNRLLKDMEYLRVPMRWRRGWSNGLKGAAWLSVAGGILLPSLFPPGAANLLGRTGTETAFIIVAVGGLLLLMDQIFNVSGSWTRLMIAELEVRKVRYELEFDWARRRPFVTEDNVMQEGPILIERLLTSVAAAHAIMDAQKRAWAMELEKAMKALEARLEKDRADLAGARSEEKQRDRKPASGAINVTVGKAEAIKPPLAVLVGGAERRIFESSVPKVFTVPDVPAGNASLELRAGAAADAGAWTWSRTVTVPDGGVAEVAVSE